jgi:hypothetical protein
MFHSNTELLLDYWRARKGLAKAPPRALIDPADIAPLAPQLFIIGRRRPGEYAFRLAGGFVEDLHGGPLAASDPLKLWAPAYRTSLQLAWEAVRRQPEPLVIDSEARARGGQSVRLEITLAPLAGRDGEIDRLIGLYQPVTPVAALAGRPVETLLVRAIAAAGSAATVAAASEFPRLKLAALDGRQIA